MERRGIAGAARAGLVAWALLGPLPLAALEPEQLPAPGSEQWEPLRFDDRRHTTYTRVRQGDRTVLRAESECAASGLTLSLADVDLADTPLLRWRWRVDEALDIEDERARGGDDFAARVYVLFPFEPSRATWMQRLRHGLGRTLFGVEPPGSALSFVWASRAEPGSIWVSPYGTETRLVALTRSRSVAWRSEAVDVGHQYRIAFGREAPTPLALGIMTDADDSCQRAVAHYADFRFTAADGP
jgi:hypothetical protein